MIDCNFFNKIKITKEILKNFNSENKNKPFDIQNYSEMFNYMVYFLQFTVLSQKSLEKRAKILIKYYQTAKFLYKYKNYASLYIFYACFSSSCITSLEKNFENS